MAPGPVPARSSRAWIRARGVSPAAAGAGAAWALVVGAALLLERAGMIEPPICLIRRATGVPCATCGGTRATVALAQGDLGTALSLNPGVVLLLLLVPAWLAWRTLGGGAARKPSGVNAGLAAVIIVALFAANWAYVLWRGA